MKLLFVLLPIFCSTLFAEGSPRSEAKPAVRAELVRMMSGAMEERASGITALWRLKADAGLTDEQIVEQLLLLTSEQPPELQELGVAVFSELVRGSLLISDKIVLDALAPWLDSSEQRMSRQAIDLLQTTGVFEPRAEYAGPPMFQVIFGYLLSLNERESFEPPVRLVSHMYIVHPGAALETLARSQTFNAPAAVAAHGLRREVGALRRDAEQLMWRVTQQNERDAVHMLIRRLQHAAQDPRPFVRLFAAGALYKLAIHAAEDRDRIKEALSQLATDENRYVRSLARDVLQNIQQMRSASAPATQGLK